jgi:hypothetical protein
MALNWGNFQNMNMDSMKGFGNALSGKLRDLGDKGINAASPAFETMQGGMGAIQEGAQQGLGGLLGRMTDKEGLFQGGEQGRLFGRVRDAWEGARNAWKGTPEETNQWWGGRAPEGLEKKDGVTFDNWQKPEGWQLNSDVFKSDYGTPDFTHQGSNIGNLNQEAIDYNKNVLQADYDGSSYEDVEGLDLGDKDAVTANYLQRQRDFEDNFSQRGVLGDYMKNMSSWVGGGGQDNNQNLTGAFSNPTSMWGNR